MATVTTACVRKPTPKEVASFGGAPAISHDGGKITITSTKATRREAFTVDTCVLEEEETTAKFTETVHGKACRQLAAATVSGCSGCVLLLGPSGSGKVPVLSGPGAANLGLHGRAVRDIFAMIEGKKKSGAISNGSVEMSYLEIFREQIRDLLNPASAEKKKTLRVKHHPKLGVLVDSLTSVAVASLGEGLRYLSTGGQVRALGRSNVNAHVECSHSVLILTVRTTAADGRELLAKLSIVSCAAMDLANEDRSLKNMLHCLRRQAEKKGKATTELPTNDSQLTMLLTDGLQGNCRLSVVATCSPSAGDVKRSATVLEVLAACSDIVKTVTPCVDPRDKLVRDLQTEISSVKDLLKKVESGEAPAGAKQKPELLQQLVELTEVLQEASENAEDRAMKQKVLAQQHTKAIAKLHQTNAVPVNVNEPRLHTLSASIGIAKVIYLRLDGSNNTIGRAANCTISLQNAKGIDTNAVALQHCHITIDPVKCTASLTVPDDDDLSDEPPEVFVNGKLVGTSKPLLLRHFDRILLGVRGTVAFRLSLPLEWTQEVQSIAKKSGLFCRDELRLDDLPSVERFDRLRVEADRHETIRDSMGADAADEIVSDIDAILAEMAQLEQLLGLKYPLTYSSSEVSEVSRRENKFDYSFAMKEKDQVEQMARAAKEKEAAKAAKQRKAKKSGKGAKHVDVALDEMGWDLGEDDDDDDEEDESEEEDEVDSDGWAVSGAKKKKKKSSKRKKKGGADSFDDLDELMEAAAAKKKKTSRRPAGAAGVAYDDEEAAKRRRKKKKAKAKKKKKRFNLDGLAFDNQEAGLLSDDDDDDSSDYDSDDSDYSSDGDFSSDDDDDAGSSDSFDAATGKRKKKKSKRGRGGASDDDDSEYEVDSVTGLKTKKKKKKKSKRGGGGDSDDDDDDSEYEVDPVTGQKTKKKKKKSSGPKINAPAHRPRKLSFSDIISQDARAGENADRMRMNLGTDLASYEATLDAARQWKPSGPSAAGPSKDDKAAYDRLLGGKVKLGELRGELGFGEAFPVEGQVHKLRIKKSMLHKGGFHPVHALVKGRFLHYFEKDDDKEQQLGGAYLYGAKLKQGNRIGDKPFSICITPSAPRKAKKKSDKKDVENDMFLGFDDEPTFVKWWKALKMASEPGRGALGQYYDEELSVLPSESVLPPSLTGASTAAAAGAGDANLLREDGGGGTDARRLDAKFEPGVAVEKFVLSNDDAEAVKRWNEASAAEASELKKSNKTRPPFFVGDDWDDLGLPTGAPSAEDARLAAEAEMAFREHDEAANSPNKNGKNGGAEDQVGKPNPPLSEEERKFCFYLPQVYNNKYLKIYFRTAVIGTDEARRAKKTRVWLVDHFTSTIELLDLVNKEARVYASRQLVQIEKDLSNGSLARLVFFHHGFHVYEEHFTNMSERERFYETANACRPTVRVFCPPLVLGTKDEYVDSTTPIEGNKPHSVEVTSIDAETKKVARRVLEGTCRLNVSRALTEAITVWTGTINLSGFPLQSTSTLDKWIPKSKHDVYAVTVQEASYRKTRRQFFAALEKYMGEEYVAVSSVALYDLLLIVLCRRRHYLKFSNVQCSSRPSAIEGLEGERGGVGISFRFMNTSMCFIGVHLPGGAGQAKQELRRYVIREVLEGLVVGDAFSDAASQFDYLFVLGDFNSQMMSKATTPETLKDAMESGDMQAYASKFDMLSIDRSRNLTLNNFVEPYISFPPTYCLEVGTDRFDMIKHAAPSFRSRVFAKAKSHNAAAKQQQSDGEHNTATCGPSFGDAEKAKCGEVYENVTGIVRTNELHCLEYASTPSFGVCDHAPVHAVFCLYGLRNAVSCFMPSASSCRSGAASSIVFTVESIHVDRNLELLCPAVRIVSPSLIEPLTLGGGLCKLTMEGYVWDSAPIRLPCANTCAAFVEQCFLTVIVFDEGQEEEAEEEPAEQQQGAAAGRNGGGGKRGAFEVDAAVTNRSKHRGTANLSLRTVMQQSNMAKLHTVHGDLQRCGRTIATVTAQFRWAPV